jgi:hypothetical protein
MMIFRSDNLDCSNIKRVPDDAMKSKKLKKIGEEKKELEHEEAKEELHQAELAEGYEQDEKFEESKD